MMKKISLSFIGHQYLGGRVPFCTGSGTENICNPGGEKKVRETGAVVPERKTAGELKPLGIQ
jgi:hypothetical protein